MKKLFLSIENLKSVSKTRCRVYQKVGVLTPYDLLYYLPRAYKDYREPVAVADILTDTQNVVKVTITRKKNPVYSSRGMQIFHADAVDDDGTELGITIFNQRFTFQTLEIGKSYVMYGKIIDNTHENRFEIQNPQLLKDMENPIEAVYPQTTGLTSPMVRTNIKECLQMLDELPFETLPAVLRDRFQLMSLPKALHTVHQPETLEEIDAAKHRIAFEELLRLELGLYLLKTRAEKKTEYPMQMIDMKPFRESLPFSMTSAQETAMQEIIRDMSGSSPMNRLLQGDVGSGKTAVAAAACYFCAGNGCQSVLMAPTEILAEQHYKTLTGFLEGLGIRVTLLTGSLTPKQKKKVCAEIADGSVQVIVGTHAVFQKAVEYQKLGLVITDEQHRFGVAQRNALAEKGGAPHKLVMSATPIPRTLALMIYGDLDVSVLDVMPNGRLPVQTYAITGKLRNRAVHFMIQELRQGRQAYIVCPAIAENEDSDSELKAVTAYAEEISKNLLKDWKLAVLHGKMSPQEKEDTMKKFHQHEIDVLICTTVVEVGVDVPNATVMLIEDAERFGLSQLHQLRGRVGRNSLQSYCILVTEHATEEAKERLKLLSSTTDGFQVAEADLQMRGPGDFFGSMQHGLPPLKLAKLTDTKMLHEVQEAAQYLLADDPNLQKEEHSALYMDILYLFSKYGMNGLN
ncbi:MAG: ATP-dependent DNA helicase RecG [Ruminococcus sp.]|nr:ATP-dependent DNA helicase RecG [Ruminococcus sp.]